MRQPRFPYGKPIEECANCPEGVLRYFYEYDDRGAMIEYLACSEVLCCTVTWQEWNRHKRELMLVGGAEDWNYLQIEAREEPAGQDKY